MRRVLLLTTLFFPPIFITGYLKWYTLVAILTAPLLALVLHGISIATYPNKVGIILATFTGSIFIFTDLVQMVAYKLTGSELGFAFWYQTNWDAILYATWLQRLEFVVVITWLFTAIFLLYRILGTVIEKPTRRSRAIWITAVPIFIAIIPWIPHSSIRPAVALASTFSHEKALVTLDPVAAKASGIKLSDINTQTLEVKGAGKNLVLIYLESFENTFLDESLFPNLAPNIQSLRREAVTFDEIIPGLNAGFTFGGIYSSLFGTHLIQAQIRGSEMRSTGLNVQVGRDLLSIPKILHLSGYEQTFVVGHASEFSGLNVLLNREGYDKIQTSVPNDGTHGIWRKTGDYWGWYDRELFEHAYDEFEQLSRKNKPFHLTILTIDTHTPDGRIEEKRREEKRREEKRREEKRREEDYPWSGDGKQLLTAAHRTDQALGEFIARIKKTSAWPNTVVLIMSDHLSWPCSIDSILAKNTHRRMNILALNSGHSPHSITTEGRTFDIAPTLLSLLEIQTNYVFPLGENLLGKPMPERLQNDSTTQEEFLRAYILRKKSNYKVNEPLRIQVKDKPYAMLHIGGILVPLTVNGNGGQAFPHNEEVCIVQLDSHGKLLSYERLKSHDQLKSRLAVIDTATTQLILLGAPHALVPDWAENPSASSESWLIYKYKNQMVQKLSNEPTALSISEDEIKR